MLILLGGPRHPAPDSPEARLSFDDAIVRFATCGTLIALHGVVDRLARRSGGDAMRAGVHPPRWMALVAFASVLAFYVLIRPHGGTLASGWGNAAGIALAFVAMGTRWITRAGVKNVRQPEMATRMLFYFALPLSVGVLWGWIALTLPAVLTCAWWCAREDRLLTERLGDSWRERIATSAHWAPGVW